MTTHSGPPFYGKYRATVTDNNDKQHLGRIRAKVTDIFGKNTSGWALPSSPYAGKDVGLFLIPPIDACVWMEFEHGDPEYPIWSGCFWAPGETPVQQNEPADIKILKTKIGTLTMDDNGESGGVTIETTAGLKIVINKKYIEIDTGKEGKIKLSGPKVSINGTALEIS